MASSWAVVLLVAGTRAAVAAGRAGVRHGDRGPASMVGFDLARTFTPVRRDRAGQRARQRRRLLRLAAAMALVGIVLDLREPRGMAAYDLDDFRAAFACSTSSGASASPRSCATGGAGSRT